MSHKAPLQLTRDNHYVPQSLLGHWADRSGQVWTYRLLVSRDAVPLWERKSTRGLAVHQHLYTRFAAGELTDETERWFEQEFESPAIEPLERALGDRQLTPADWRRLIRLLAAQDVRTPARLMESLKRWEKELPTLVTDTLTDAVERFKDARRKGAPLPTLNPDREAANFPARVSLERDGGSQRSTLGLHVTVGRSLWLFSLKHLLTNTIQALERHRWTILRPPAGMAWVTSDAPVLRLNYRDSQRYDFGGGWGSIGTKIFLPLGPRHLMYTQIGAKPPARGSVVPHVDAFAIQRFMIEHAHRFVFASSVDPYVAEVRTRRVDEDAFRAEAAEWAKWHVEQTSAERDIGAQL